LPARPLSPAVAYRTLTLPCSTRLWTRLRSSLDTYNVCPETLNATEARDPRNTTDGDEYTGADSVIDAGEEYQRSINNFSPINLNKVGE
jgi:hypothetical protein